MLDFPPFGLNFDQFYSMAGPLKAKEVIRAETRTGTPRLRKDQLFLNS